MSLELDMTTLVKKYSDELEEIFQNGTWTPRYTSVGFVAVLVNDVFRTAQDAILKDFKTALSVPKNHAELVDAARNNQQVRNFASRGQRVQAIHVFRKLWVDNDGRSLLSAEEAKDAVDEAYGLSSDFVPHSENDLSDVEPPF